jgi:acyl-CoA oxidase
LNWICSYLLEKTYTRVKSLQQQGHSQFDTRNNSQVFNAINLSLAYGYRQTFAIFFNEVQRLPMSPEKDVLSKLLSLFGANLIVTKYIGTLYEGGYVDAGVNVTDLLQTGILELLPSLKDEAIALVDAIAHPDFIINSPLGMSDGNIYKHLESYIYQTNDTFTRPSWWKEVVHEDFLQSKL